MPLNAEAILKHPFPDIEVTFTNRDCILYALSIGFGQDPMNVDELSYVFEKNMRVFPTFAAALGQPGPWNADPKFGLTRQMLVHGTERLELLRPLQCDQALIARNRVLEVIDKGADKGAIVVVERTLTEKASGAVVARVETGLFCRADGGFDGKREVTREFSDTPKHPPDISQVISTQANQALYYRLNGDRNPLHADPDYAKMAGFPRPILHGLCTYSAVAICLQRMVGLDRELLSIQARFSKPVYPGETIQVDSWHLSSGIAFRATVTDRNVEVLGRGLAKFL